MELVARAVEVVGGHEVDRLLPVLGSGWPAAAPAGPGLVDAVGAVVSLRVALPEGLLVEQHRRELRVGSRGGALIITPS